MNARVASRLDVVMNRAGHDPGSLLNLHGVVTVRYVRYTTYIGSVCTGHMHLTSLGRDVRVRVSAMANLHAKPESHHPATKKAEGFTHLTMGSAETTGTLPSRSTVRRLTKAVADE